MRRAVEDGEGTAEEGGHSSEASADSFCRVMGLLGMGHRLFVPKLLAVREGGLGNRRWMRETERAGTVWFKGYKGMIFSLTCVDNENSY